MQQKSWTPMPKATINDVAKLANVSIKTVSRVVNREPNVRKSTGDRVEKAIAELNYRPNQYAQNLASRRARLIGLIYDDPSAYEIPSAGYVIRMQHGTDNGLWACRCGRMDVPDSAARDISVPLGGSARQRDSSAGSSEFYMH